MGNRLIFLYTGMTFVNGDVFFGWLLTLRDMFCGIVVLFKCLSLGRGVIARTRCRHDEMSLCLFVLTDSWSP